MTLIAFATYGDRAEFITDTVSYTANVSELGSCTKALTFPHIDAAVLAQGDSQFCDDAKATALKASAHFEGFDALVESAPAWLRSVWSSHQAGGPLDDTTVILLGWSERERAFVAWQFASEHDFQPVNVSGLWVWPTPWTAHPTDLESVRLVKFGKRRPNPQNYRDAAESWMRASELASPASASEWHDLAIQVREQRALEEFSRVIVAGDVFHTVMRRGETATKRIHRYDDTGDELSTMVTGTQHPVSQAAPC